MRVFAAAAIVCSAVGFSVMAQSVAPRATPSAQNATVYGVFGNGSSAEQGSKVGKLLSSYRETNEETERGRLMQELTGAVAEEFDARQKSREQELAKLEEQVRKLRELQKRREQEKDQIVADRVRQLVRDVDGLGWGGDASDSGSNYGIPGNRGQSLPPGVRAMKYELQSK
jgi:hypothetical protein